MGWVESAIWWFGLGWVDENRPTDNSEYRVKLPLTVTQYACYFGGRVFPKTKMMYTEMVKQTNYS